MPYNLQQGTKESKTLYCNLHVLLYIASKKIGKESIDP